MIIEKKDEKADGVELWTVAPGSVVQFGDSAGHWLVTDSCDSPDDESIYTRRFAQEERGYSVIVINLADGELIWRVGNAGVAVVEAKVVIE